MRQSDSTLAILESETDSAIAPQLFFWTEQPEQEPSSLDAPHTVVQKTMLPFIVFVFAMILLGFLRRLTDFRLRSFFSSLFSPSPGREGHAFSEYTLLLFSIAVFALSISFFLPENLPDPIVASISPVIIIMGLLVVFYALRYALIRFMAYVFRAWDFSGMWIQFSRKWGIAAAFFMLFPLLIIYYADQQLASFFIRYMPVIVLGIYVFRFLSFPALSKGLPKLFYLYILLYLCSLEIIPLLLAAKFLGIWI